ncbi:NADH dehydrogenase I, D subunit [Sulfobacillus acidophilus TPY]|uniref:NADH-quinone oxidoreductase subunit D n=1 Tax=Sulfobacillus acidophilus (strain ATCC 700253 / DSM 10332 / NAL) TaxID=679936 RepID=G8TX69_SULAD|nr:NADH dehydrogenase I, D subunit [Sulfobacillus acidophilus TPY]AEW06071.1 NADH dehydrogenase subunit D [Sulfobacillus acidophilus DSM 10332]
MSKILPPPTIRHEELILNLGPQHPSTHGVFRVVLHLQGETIVGVTPHMGYLHRGFEKLAERRTAVQYQPYPDRWDYLAAMFDEMAYIGAGERLLALEAPPRAEVLRGIVMELNRIASHLLWLGTFLLDVGALSPFLYTFREREMILDLLMELTGARLTYNFMRFGGVRYDASDMWVKKVAVGIGYFRAKFREYRTLIEDNAIFRRRVHDIGVIDGSLAIRMGLSGPMLRASGVSYDLRRHRPYGIYRQVLVPVVTRTTGDTWARYQVRMDELDTSLNLVETFLEKLPTGPIMAKVPRIIKFPEDETYFAVEGPRGELGVYLVGNGTPHAKRLKIRPPSLFNLEALEHLLRGHMVSDAIAILGSIDIVLGEVDR